MPKEKRLLLLFDGNALVHRAFHALPPLTVPKTGEMVGAVYGFASMLLKVLSDIKPTHYAIAFDRPTPTFRHHRFEEYKAQRPPTPDELTGQYRRLRELIEAFRIPVFEMEGYEADDILGSLSRQASVQGIDTIIVTGDADAMQLVSPKVQVLMPRRAFGDTMLYDEAAVGQKYGVEPRQIADLKALEGDSSDNIPGVPGIGPKTAVKLIGQFGSLEEVYAHVDEVTPAKLGQTLQANQELAVLSKELATIVTEVPVELELDACQVSAYDRSRVVELFRTLEFASLISKLPETERTPDKTEVRTTPQGDYRIIDTIPALDELAARLAGARSFVIDVETTAKEAMHAQLVGIALSAAPGEAYYVPVGHIGWQGLRQLPLPQAIDRLKPLIEDPRIAKTAHNGNYDMSVLAQHGVKLQNLSFDTMIAAHLLGEKSLGLKALAFSKLGIEMTPLSALIGSGAKKTTMAAVDIAEAAQYACADADLTLRLRELLEAELHEQGLWKLFAEVEMPLVPVLVLMQQHGVAIDTDLLRRMSQSLGQQMLQLELDIYNSVGHKFNINSTQQLGAVLFDELGLPRARKTKSGYSTEASILEALRGSHPVVEQVLEYRQLMKLKSTYIDALPGLINPKTGRVHTSFRQTGTATGRLSSSDPNLQNIPIRSELGRQVRHAFIAPPPTVLLAADYSQIDLRVLAHLSQDPYLLASFRRDEDIHAATASQVFGVSGAEVTGEMRRVAKTVNFGVIYGMSEYGLEQATELSREEASQFIDAYFEKYSGVKAYLDSTKEQARQQGFVQTLLGRRRYIPEINSRNRQVREAAERMAINMPVQGTSADIIKIAMIELHGEMAQRGLKAKMTLQVHDELVFEVPEEEVEELRELVARRMTKALELSLPLKVDIKVGRNWGEMEPDA